MKKIIIPFLVIFCLFLPGFVRAQEEEHIQSYKTDVAIEADGTIGVKEQIQYLFVTPRHGIFRNIPYIKTNDSGKRYALTLSRVEIVDEKGTPYQFTQSQEGDNVVFKIGDPDTTITGTHWYDISYTVSGAITYFPGHDELNWNVIGTGWPVPMTQASASVTLPQSISSTDLHSSCFVGVVGSKSQDCTVVGSGKVVTMNVNRTLESDEGATVVVGFPKGIVAVLEPKEVVPFFSTFVGKITLVFLGILAFLWYILSPFFIIYRWWKYGRDPKPSMGEVSAWFSPPKTKNKRDLTPAETGTLVDESADLRDIYATIVDLARRGYLKIIETKKKTSILTKVEAFDFEKQKNWSGDKELQLFETELLSGIFKTKDHVSVKDLTLFTTFEKIKKDLYELVVSDGFFPKSPQTTRTIYYVIAILALFTGNLLLTIIAFIFGRSMPRKTLFGAEQAAVGRSLKNFLVSQDRQLAFQAKNQMMFEKLLPYAIAFGVEEIWAKRFKGIALKRPDWYVSGSGGTFNSILFASSLGRGMSSSFASSITQHSSSGFSSGFSGGGFSGGGGGGGGGGSW